MELTFIIPCYNEDPEVLVSTVRRIEESMERAELTTFSILVVNDGSKRYDYSNVKQDTFRIIDHQFNKGYGASLKTGIAAATTSWVAIVDADGTYPVERFPELIAAARDCDMVVGARSWKDISWIRRPAKKAITRLASYIAGAKIPDLNSGMRVFKRELVDEYLRIYPNQFSFSSTLTMVGLTNLFYVKFVPIDYYKRIGQSSIHPIKDTMRFVTQLLRLSLYFSPLRLFVPLSLAVGLLALARGMRDILLVNHIGGLALVLTFMAFQIFFFGLIAEIINKKN